ncbi:replication protein P [Azotobacter beijerinckii]|uniref:replication protein P n=1 Tax=Azotobacter beijerinckii TaxID=170623 RepID=UPI002952E9D1|nr:replication protein P [Azotobacter beijerinckii]MDV7209934.1 replication protein P [Azotobacter beijerinckii]
MQTAHEIATRIDPATVPVTAKAVVPKQLDEGSALVINAVFRELQSCCPAWRQAWPDDKALAAAKKSWTKAFMAAGLHSLEQVRLGVEQLRLRHGDDRAPWVPGSGEFIALCQPSAEALGLPEAGKAYREACRNAHPAAEPRWSHPAVHHAACETGFHELRSLPEEKSRKLFERAYAVTVRMLLAGEPLREIPKALPEKVSICTPEVGRSALAGLRSALKGGSA